MDSLGFKILLALVCFCTVASQEVMVDILGVGEKVETPVGAEKEFTCHINQGLAFIISNKILWVHVSSLKPEDDPGVMLTEQGALKDAASPSDYAVDLQHNATTITVKLTLKSVMNEQDGRFICRVIDSQSEDVQMEKEVEMVVYSNVEKVELVFDNEQAVTTIEPNAVQRKEGTYDVSCKATGFNPDAKVTIFLGQRQIGTTETEPTYDDAASEAAGARRYTAEVSVTAYELTADDADDESIRCVAKGTFDNAVPKTASFPLQIIALEPTIVCDKNITRNVGDLYVTIKCEVDHSTVEVAGYEYEIGETGEKIAPPNMTSNYDEVRLSPINATATEVVLELYELREKHVDMSGGATYFYLDVHTKNGKTFREKAVLYVGTSAASRPAAFIVAILISLLFSL